MRGRILIELEYVPTRTIVLTEARTAKSGVALLIAVEKSAAWVSPSYALSLSLKFARVAKEHERYFKACRSEIT